MYATLDELKTWIGSHTTDDDHHLEPVLRAASKAVDDECGRTFTHATAQARYRYPSSASSVSVVDLISATEIALDTNADLSFATILAATDYYLAPLSDARGQPSERYQEILIWPTSARSFDPSRQVRITGNWGYASVPDDVRVATLLIASRYWKRHESPLGILEATDLGTFARLSESDPDVCKLLADYSRTAGTGSGWVVV